MKKMGRPTKAEMALRAKEKAELEMIRRTGGRLKKATKVFDPSENYIRKRRNPPSTDKNEQIKDGPTNSKAKETNALEEPYLKLQALDELLSLNDDENVATELNKCDDFLNVVKEENSAISETSRKSKDSDTEFTPDAKKVQKSRGPRKRSKIILQKNTSKEEDPEFIPDGIHKNLKFRKQKFSTLVDDSIALIKSTEDNSKETKKAVTDEVIPSKPQRGRPCKRSKTDIISICSICFHSKTTQLITCVDCNTKAHKTCLKTNFNNKNLLEFEWHCDNCKICEICYETYEIGKIITCSLCVKSYHTVCHVPTIIDDSPNFDQTNWVCTRCANRIGSSSKIVQASMFSNNDASKTTSPLTTSMHNSSDVLDKENDIDKSVIRTLDHNLLIKKLDNISLSTTPVEDLKLTEVQPEQNLSMSNAAQNQKHLLINKFDNKNLSTTSVEHSKLTEVESEQNLPIIKEEKKLKNLNGTGEIEAEDIPDVSMWSCERLSQFIAEIFPNEAHVFTDQEIDGAALLLMNRSFVLTGLGLKLGPALRLYNFIITLQTRKHDVFASWY